MNPDSPVILQGQNTLDPKPEKDCTKEKLYRNLIYENIWKKILNIASQI